MENIGEQKIHEETVRDAYEAKERAEREAFARRKIGGTVRALHVVESKRDDRDVIKKCKKDDLHWRERKPFDDKAKYERRDNKAEALGDAVDGIVIEAEEYLARFRKRGLHDANAGVQKDNVGGSLQGINRIRDGNPDICLAHGRQVVHAVAGGCDDVSLLSGRHKGQLVLR